MKRLFLVASLVALVLGLVSARVLRSRVFAQNTQPFTLETEEKYFDQTGSEVEKLSRTKVIAVNSAGVVSWNDRSKWDGPADQVPSGYFDQRVVTDQSDGRVTASYPALKMKTTLPLTPAEVDRPYGTPKSDCNRKGWLANPQFDMVIAGQQAVYVEKNRTNKGFEWTTKEWKAPALGCVTLRKESILQREGHYQKMVVTTTRLTLGEPSGTLFTPVSDWKETTPSEALVAIEQLHGRRCPDCEKHTGSQADANYAKRWADAKQSPPAH